MRTFLPLLALLGLCAAGVRAQEPYRTSDEAAAAIRSLIGEMETRNNCMTDAHRDNDRNNAEIRKQNQKIYDLRKEMARVLDEYRRGEFCSGCGKTRSEILATGSVFPHPGQKIIAATQEQLDSKEREYRNRINSLVNQNQRYRDHYQDILARWTKCRDEKVRAEAGIIQAQYWTQVLSQREEAERKRKEREELQRKLMEKLEAERRQRELEMERARLEAQAREEARRQEALQHLQRVREQLEEQKRRFQNILDGIKGMFGRGDDQVTTPPYDEDDQQINSGYLGTSFSSVPGYGEYQPKPRPGILDNALARLRDAFKTPEWSDGVNSGLSLLTPDDPFDAREWAEGETRSFVADRARQAVREFFRPYVKDHVYDGFAGERLDQETRDALDRTGLWENTWNEWDFLRGRQNVWQKIFNGSKSLYERLTSWHEELLNGMSRDINREFQWDDY